MKREKNQNPRITPNKKYMYKYDGKQISPKANNNYVRLVALIFRFSSSILHFLKILMMSFIYIYIMLHIENTITYM